MNRVGEVAASVAACSESLKEDGIFQIKQHKLTAVKELKRAGKEQFLTQALLRIILHVLEAVRQATVTA